MFCPHGGEPVDVVPAGLQRPDARARVRRRRMVSRGRVVFCSSFDDSRLYRMRAPGAEPQPITPEPPEPHAAAVRGRPGLRGRPSDRLRARGARGRRAGERARRLAGRRLERAARRSRRPGLLRRAPPKPGRHPTRMDGVGSPIHAVRRNRPLRRRPRAGRLRHRTGGASPDRRASRSFSPNGAPTGCSTSSPIAPAGRICTSSARAGFTPSRAKRPSSAIHSGSSTSRAMRSSQTGASLASSRGRPSTASSCSIRTSGRLEQVDLPYTSFYSPSLRSHGKSRRVPRVLPDRVRP